MISHKIRNHIAKWRKHSRGITVSAGGPLYFLNAYLNVRLLRAKGCTLPVSWFYLGDEMRKDWLEAIHRIDNVVTYNLGGSGDYSKGRGGWQSKIEAIIRSPFDEVLLLDADCFPKRDPAYLFQHPFYLETGAVLWPDIWHWQPDRMQFLNKRYGIQLGNTRQIESGQVMFDKRCSMTALEKIRKLNQDSSETYKVVYGDKDTFLIGLLQAKQPFHIVETPPGFCSGGLIQHDFDGAPLFVHLTGGKFRWHGRAFVPESVLPGVTQTTKFVKDIHK